MTTSEPASGPTEFIWRDGRMVPWRDATIHVMSHVVHYGTSVFEGVRCYETPNGGAIFRLQDHMRRLHDSARIYRMELGHAIDELVAACVETVRANDLTQCYLRPVAVRTAEEMAVYSVGLRVETFIIAWRWGSYLGEEGVKNGVDVCVSSWRRPAPGTLPVLAKAGGNYLLSQLAKIEARQDQYSEGIMLDASGIVAEGSGENLFLARDGALYTAPTAAGILPGITRDSVIRLARDRGIEIREQAIPREMLYIADEAFFCGTAAEITPIRSIDRIPVGSGKPGPITRGLQEEYLGIAKGRLPDRFGWLTPVPRQGARHTAGRVSSDVVRSSA